MYVPPSFRETDPGFIRSFISNNGFATLVTSDQGVPLATHLLLELQEREGSRLVLSGHIARANPQWKTFDPKRELLAIFQGPHAYVSASWYSVKSAPTWNYVNVHAYGLPRIVEDRGELFALLKRLVDRQESGSPESSRFTIESMPPATRESMMDAIVGFEIDVTRVEAAAKLSQNRSAEDYERTIMKLKERGDPSSARVAEEMERRRKPTGKA